MQRGWSTREPETAAILRLVAVIVGDEGSDQRGRPLKQVKPTRCLVERLDDEIVPGERRDNNQGEHMAARYEPNFPPWVRHLTFGCPYCSKIVHV